jgi:hypothetical protein
LPKKNETIRIREMIMYASTSDVNITLTHTHERNSWMETKIETTIFLIGSRSQNVPHLVLAVLDPQQQHQQQQLLLQR